MVDLLATIRPDDWNLVLFLHILGAMVTVGAFVLAFVYLIAAWRGGSVRYLRAGYKALLWGAIPSYFVMRVAAQWLYSEQGIADLPEEPAWVGLGYAISDLGLLLLVIATVTAGLSSRRALAAGADAQPSTGAIRTATVLTAIMLLTYVIAVWAMTAKP